MNIPSQNKEKQVLYVAERLLPVHTRRWMVLNDNKLVGPLKGHSTLEYGKGIEVINDERLHHKKAAADASTAAIETTKKKMEVFVEEELEPVATTCEKVAFSIRDNKLRFYNNNYNEVVNNIKDRNKSLSLDITSFWNM